MIGHLGNVFVLQTAHTSYLMRVTESGHLEHLYYGKRITVKKEEDAAFLFTRQAFLAGNTIAYHEDFPELTLEDLPLEYGTRGKGDIREPFVEVVFPEGLETVDLLYETFLIRKGGPSLAGLPCSYGDKEEVDTLTIRCKDRTHPLVLELNYHVYSGRDVITRTSRLCWEGEEPLTVKRLMSTQLDILSDEMSMTSFTGSWVNEMNKKTVPVVAGRVVNDSFTGTSSNRANPFVMLSEPDTTEEQGAVYGINLVYSGDHYEACDVSAYHRLRFLSGIQPASFSYRLHKGETFEAPEAVMSFSEEGFTGLSKRMHDFIRNHIVRGTFKDKPRPVLLNSWEACYFQLNEGKLLNLAKKAKQAGIELFVMDDGWFTGRKDDHHGLGDWEEDEKKLPGGLAGLSDKIHGLGLLFGLWIEPEMVNVQSEFYKAHPDWCIDHETSPHSEGRNQRLLDLSRPEVVEALAKIFIGVLKKAKVDYVKWDMNRIFSDRYSRALPADRQGELVHRYVLGLYRLLSLIMEPFPEVLFEGCASGGNRFDLGMLCFFPQIWASDNTDAICRAKIQYHYSYGYPQSVITSHVSASPNHQTLRQTPLSTRFAVATFGILGYELNLCDASEEELSRIREQIKDYKAMRSWLFAGQVYRLSFGKQIRMCIVSPDKKKALGLLVNTLTEPGEIHDRFAFKGLDPERYYQLYHKKEDLNLKVFGDLINTASPIHIKPNSLLHSVIAKVKTMPGEQEEGAAYGDLLMSCGIMLSPRYQGTGFDERVRAFKDFSAKLYELSEKV